jgi:GNAT superfamily N-acetyltransferase
VSSVVIRGPKKQDAAAIAQLMTELGYPATAGQIPARLEALAFDPSTVVWVGELDGDVVALGTGKVFAVINADGPTAQLTALVVAERVRGRGVGREMVRAAEEWARARGATRLTLTSAVHRERAHEFYKRLGYEHTGVRLAKSL